MHMLIKLVTDQSSCKKRVCTVAWGNRKIPHCETSGAALARVVPHANRLHLKSERRAADLTKSVRVHGAQAGTTVGQFEQEAVV